MSAAYSSLPKSSYLKTRTKILISLESSMRPVYYHFKDKEDTSLLSD